MEKGDRVPLSLAALRGAAAAGSGGWQGGWRPGSAGGRRGRGSPVPEALPGLRLRRPPAPAAGTEGSGALAPPGGSASPAHTHRDPHRNTRAHSRTHARRHPRKNHGSRSAGTGFALSLAYRGTGILRGAGTHSPLALPQPADTLGAG